MQRQIKALGNDPQHKAAVEYIIDAICGRHRASFLAGVPHATETTAWLEGRRFIGETLARIIERPIQEDPPEAEPPPRTMTERAQRRNMGSV